MKIGVKLVNQMSKLTGTGVNNIVDVAVNCVQIVERILRQSPRSALCTLCREYNVKELQHWPKFDDRSTEDATCGRSSKVCLLISSTERQKTAFCVNFFYWDVVLPIDA